jgi:protein phosphatase methylesterase 1
VNRLDKDLTIAQMQGKFEMKIVGHSGHFIHEDVPSAAVNVLNEFFRRRLT